MRLDSLLAFFVVSGAAVAQAHASHKLGSGHGLAVKRHQALKREAPNNATIMVGSHNLSKRDCSGKGTYYDTQTGNQG